MGTGIVAILIYKLPYNTPGVQYVGIAFFIKAFIDADDVDVRGTNACLDNGILILDIPFS